MDEGRISRAMSKAGEGEQLSPKPARPKEAGEGKPFPSKPATASPAPRLANVDKTRPTGTRPTPASFRRVKNQCGDFSPRVVMVRDRGGEVAFQVRAVRARLLSANNGNPPRVITVCSSVRQEGKTTMAFNIAVALSEIQSGRVALVDGDVAAPELHDLAGLNPSTGLKEILQSQLRLDDNVYETRVPGLDIIPARAFDDTDIASGLVSRRCKEFLAKLRKFYAHVIIDTAPVLGGSEACVFGKYSDGVLLMAQLEKTPRDIVKRTVDELTQSGAKIIGCVLTHRKHHVPDFIYRFFGTTPRHHYSYYRKARGVGHAAGAPNGDKSSI